MRQLLLPNMSEKDSPEGAPKRAKAKKRLIWYLGLASAASVTVGTVAAPVLSSLTNSDPLQSAVRDYNFQPMDPPSTAYGPGSIYLVDMFGKIKAQVCSAENVETKPNVHDAEDAIVSSLITASSATDASIVERLEIQAEGESIAQVHLILKKVKIANFDLATVSGINTELQSDERCSAQVATYISQGRCLVQSHAVLVATSGFTYTSKTGTTVKVNTNAEVKDLLISTTGSLQLRENIMRAGKKLYYGFQLADRCMMLPDAKAPRYVPDEEWWYVAALRNLWSWGLERTEIAWISIQRTYAEVVAATHSTV